MNQQPYTELQLTKVSTMWSQIAGESIRVEEITGKLYAFGSELGCRRLAHKFRSFDVKFSENKGSWYFSMERKF